MAYGTHGKKYTLEFTDIKGVEWVIDVFKKAYVGSVTTVVGSGDPLAISYKGGDLFEPVRSSEVSISFQSTTNFQFSEFFSALATDYLVEIKKATIIFWRGIFVPENYSEAYRDTPYEISLRFSCGLGYLKTIEYKNGANFYEGLSSITTILLNCFNKLPFNIKLREYINILEDDIAALDDEGFAINTFIDNLCFKSVDKKTFEEEAWMCLDVIEEIVKSIGSTVYQTEDKWTIVRIREYETAAVKFVDYTTAGAYDTDNIKTVQLNILNDGINPHWIKQDAELLTTETFNKIIYQYFYSPPSLSLSPGEDGFRAAGELIADWQFAHHASWTTGDWWDYWIRSANVVAEGNYNFAKVVGVGQGLRIREATLAKTPILDKTYSLTATYGLGKTITFKDLSTGTADTAKISLVGWYILEFYHGTIGNITWGSGSPFNTNLWYDMQVHFSFQVGTFYLKEDTDGTLSWTNTSTDTFSIKLTRHGQQNDGFTALDSGPTRARLLMNFNTDLTLPTFPETAIRDVTLIMYLPENPDMTLDYSGRLHCFEFNLVSLSLQFQPNNEILLGNPITIQTTANVRNRDKTIDVKFGDVPSPAVKLGFKLADGSVTDAWFNRTNPGTTDTAANIFILTPYASYFSEYRQILMGTLYGDISIANTLLTKYGELFFIDSMTYNVKLSRFNVALIELTTTVITLSAVMTAELYPGHDVPPTTTNTPIPTDDLVEGTAMLSSQNTTITPYIGYIDTVNDKKTQDTSFDNYPL